MNPLKIKTQDLKLVLEIFENDTPLDDTVEISEIRNGIMLYYKNRDGSECEIMLTSAGSYLGPKIRRTNWARKDKGNVEENTNE